MKKGLFFLLLLFSALNLWPIDGRAEILSRLMADHSYFENHFPRYEGSTAEKEVLAFIEAKLKSLEVFYNTYDFSESDTSHSFSSCIEAVIPGDKPDTLIIAVPLNHPMEAEELRDGSFSLALALSLIRQAAESRPRLTLRVLFLGAEYGEDNEYPMGSRLFLKDFYPEYRVMVLYLNLLTVPERISIRSGGRGLAAPYWLIERATESLKKAQLFFRVRGNENQVFRIGLDTEKTIIEPFLFAGYPALSLEGDYSPLSPPQVEEWLLSFHIFIDKFLESFDLGIPEEWDRHYLFFQVRGFYLILSEKTYLVLILAVLTSMFLYSLVFTNRLKKYLKILMRKAWTLPLIFVLSFALFLAASWFIHGLLYLRRLPLLWAELPLFFLAFKLSFALITVILLSALLRRLPFSRNGSFYSASALLFLFLDIIILGAMDISFTYYFVWALIFALLFAASPNRIIKLIAFLISPYWLIKSVIELFTLPILEFCRIVLLSKIWGNLLLTFSIIPFLLMLIRLEMIFPPILPYRRAVRVRMRLAALGAVLGALIILFLLYFPYNERNFQPVKVVNSIDLDGNTNLLELSSPAPLGEIGVRDGDRLVKVNTRSTLYSMPLMEMPVLLTTTVESTAFLDRKNITVRVFPDLNLPGGDLGSTAEQLKPFKVGLLLTAPDEFVLYDSNLPYLRGTGGREYRLLMGATPPLPITIQLTLPQGANFELEIDLKYHTLPGNLEIRGENIHIKPLQIIRKKIELKT
jgi:hypothetical protein